MIADDHDLPRAQLCLCFSRIYLLDLIVTLSLFTVYFPSLLFNKRLISTFITALISILLLLLFPPPSLHLPPAPTPLPILSPLRAGRRAMQAAAGQRRAGPSCRSHLVCKCLPGPARQGRSHGRNADRPGEAAPEPERVECTERGPK